jgi:hypothetical protein
MGLYVATGYIVFTVEGRMMSSVEAEGRKHSSTDEESPIPPAFAISGNVSRL